MASTLTAASFPGGGMSDDTALPHGLTEAFAHASGVDDVARATLRWVTALEGVTRAGLALTVVGGRQLRFLSSDEGSLGPPPRWCLIDAYDRLPLNDALRTGRAVVLYTSSSLRRTYPELADRQDPAAVRSLVALPLTSADQRLGGLLLYRDRELDEDDTDLQALLAQAAARVAQALIAARPMKSTVSPVIDQETLSGEDRPPSRTASLRLPDDATAPGTARLFLKEALEDWGTSQEVVDSALLCTSEVVTNVIMHVQQSSVITAQRDDGRLIIRVDQPAFGVEPVIAPAAEHDDPLVIAGRGLILVDAVASRWGTETTPSHVRVWFELELTDW